MGRRYKFDTKEETVIEYPIDAEFLDVLGMQLVAGRTFDPAITSDATTSVVVNEALVHDVLGITPEEALGREFTSSKGTDRKVISRG